MTQNIEGGASPLFTVVLNTFNRAHLLPTCIASILAQTETDWELVIINDGSSDDTEAVVGTYKDPRIRYYYQENQGLAAARNAAARQSRGQYLCFIDDDDEFTEDHLAVFRKEIESQSYPVAIFYAQGYIVRDGVTSILRSITCSGGVWRSSAAPSCCSAAWRCSEVRRVSRSRR